VVDGPKGTRIALMICADSKYQELWREARLQGANLVIHISNWPAPYEHWHKLSNQAGAFFNELTVLAVNSVGTDDSYVFCGNSMVVDTNGKLVAEAPVGHEWLLEAVINPGAAAAGVASKITSNLVWEAVNRGASCPDNDGVGLGLDDYTAYNAIRF
jgi:amidase/formamidase